MGKVLSSLSRQVKMFNIEARAHKIISKEKPTVAPSYPYAIKDMERADREDPGFMEKEKIKDMQLDKHLKDVYVVSRDPVKKAESTKETKEDRPLPLMRSSVDYPEYGYVEPGVTEVPQGKFTLKQAMKFIADHQSQPDVYTAQHVAKDYKIDVKLAENVVTHFRMFDLHMPKTREKKDEITLLNYYGKCKELVENLYKSRAQQEYIEKGKDVKESSSSPTVIKHSELQGKSSSNR